MTIDIFTIQNAIILIMISLSAIMLLLIGLICLMISLKEQAKESRNMIIKIGAKIYEKR